MSAPGYKYLLRQTDPQIRLAAETIEASAKQPWNQVLVVPACDEPWQPLARMLANCRSHNSLFVLVLNEPDNASASCQQTNHNLLASLREKESLQLLAPHTWQSQDNHLLVLDFLGSAALSQRAGVGLARKLGNDLSALLQERGCIRSNWICNSDADATLPDDYFRCELPDDASALIHPHRYAAHNCNRETYRATLAYDLRLEQYRQGLEAAGSHYAYTPHGSTIRVRTRDYLAAHGFPLRAAGEDFYLLNKLQKLSGVRCLSGPAIELQARHSNRVPFGTGPAVSELMRFDNLENAPLLYDPRIFQKLSELIQLLEQTRPPDWARAADNRVVATALESLKPEAAVRHLTDHWPNRQRYLDHLHGWFDAFRTLKFVQFLRRQGMQDLTLAQWRSTYGETSLPAGHRQALQAAASLPTSQHRTPM